MGLKENSGEGKKLKLKMWKSQLKVKAFHTFYRK